MSLTFLLLLMIKLFYKEITIDNITILLALLIFVPWFIQYVKTLEISGLGKVEFVNKEKKAELERKAKSVGSSVSTETDPTKHIFYNLRYEDPKLALAALRVEIEDKLHSIADKEGLDTGQAGINQLADTLSKNKLLSNNQLDVITDLTTVLNKAVHSQLKTYKKDSLEWIIDIGLKLINSLEEKC
jgi:hypothetical protein